MQYIFFITSDPYFTEWCPIKLSHVVSIVIHCGTDIRVKNYWTLTKGFKKYGMFYCRLAFQNEYTGTKANVYSVGVDTVDTNEYCSIYG